MKTRLLIEIQNFKVWKNKNFELFNFIAWSNFHLEMENEYAFTLEE